MDGVLSPRKLHGPCSPKDRPTGADSCQSMEVLAVSPQVLCGIKQPELGDKCAQSPRTPLLFTIPNLNNKEKGLIENKRCRERQTDTLNDPQGQVRKVTSTKKRAPGKAGVVAL